MTGLVASAVAAFCRAQPPPPGGTAATAAGTAPAGADTAAPTPAHGTELRGLDLVIQDPTG